MGIYITGDIHGNASRLNVETFYEQCHFSDTEDNHIIILGDFGLIWNSNGRNNYGESKYEKYWLDWINEKNFTTLFIDGNHENFTRLAAYPITEYKGGKVHQIRSKIYHLMRGQVFTINNKKIFTMGGASSHDIRDGILDPEDYPSYASFKHKASQLDKEMKQFRIKGLSWWEEELPNEQELEEGKKNLFLNNNKVDYILSHSPSTTELYLLGGKGLYEPDKLTNYLDEIKANVEYEKHYFGHMHINQAINDKDICLYEQILRIN